jgi:hypothetical protein
MTPAIPTNWKIEAFDMEAVKTVSDVKRWHEQLEAEMNYRFAIAGEKTDDESNALLSAYPLDALLHRCASIRSTTFFEAVTKIRLAMSVIETGGTGEGWERDVIRFACVELLSMERQRGAAQT